MREDKYVFPYTSPSKKAREKYIEIFELKKPLRERPCKWMFDRIFSLIAVLLASPLFCMIIAVSFLNGLLFPEDRGSIFTAYSAASRGKKFDKLKFRLAKDSLIDKKLRQEGDFRAFPSERKPENLTRVGKFLKKYYLDELPQIINIFKGDISFVGPRPLAWRHYQRDLRQGNINRKILKAGLFSDTHTRKGTPYFHNLDLEYRYIEKYMKLLAPQLLWADIQIMARGIKMVFEGKGY